VLVAAVPATSPAHDADDLLSAGATEAEMRAIETALLGPEHAAEHAAARAALRPAARGDLTETSRAAISSEGAPVRAAGPRSEVGAWTQGPFAIPTYAIHSVLLPTGKVLFWGRPPAPTGSGTRPNFSDAALWSPWLGTGPVAFTDVDPPVMDVDGPGGQDPVKAPIFCSGETLLPTGEVLVAGGTLIYAGTFSDDEYTDWAGLQTLFTFDPWSETWTRQPNMAEGRWYPTQTLLADGRTTIAGGFGDLPPGGLLTNTVEVFNPPTQVGGQGTVVPQPTADRAGLGLYPRMFSVGDDVIVTGPSKALTATLDTTSFTWTESLRTMSRSRIAGNAVRRPGDPSGSDTFTSLGGFDRSLSPGPFYPATETSETIDLDGSATWKADAPLNVARANANLVLLPDGSMVEVGGGSGFQDGGDPELGAAGGYVTYADGRARQIEVYDPDSNSWLLGPAQEEDRTYHSTALLLPDGRVFSAGDDHYPLEPGGGLSPRQCRDLFPAIPVQRPAAGDRLRPPGHQLGRRLRDRERQHRYRPGRADGPRGDDPRVRHEPAPRRAQGARQGQGPRRRRPFAVFRRSRASRVLHALPTQRRRGALGGKLASDRPECARPAHPGADADDQGEAAATARQAGEGQGLLRQTVYRRGGGDRAGQAVAGQRTKAAQGDEAQARDRRALGGRIEAREARTVETPEAEAAVGHQGDREDHRDGHRRVGQRGPREGAGSSALPPAPRTTGRSSRNPGTPGPV
jgi:hypothetical protein